MEQLRVSKIFTFDMAHALYNYDGLCKNIHGHTYVLTITLQGRVKNEIGHPKDGMVTDFSVIKQVVKENIIDTYDHALVLNSNADEHNALAQTIIKNFPKIVLLEIQPTCENLLLTFKNALRPIFETLGLKLVKVKLQETPTSFAEWEEGL